MQTIAIQAPKKLKPLFKRKKRFKVAYGGRGSAKSTSFANAFIIQAYHGAMIGCFREFQTSIDDSVHSLLKAQIEKTQIPGFEVLKTQINHLTNGGFRFKGLARSIEAVKSMHGFKYFWVEEGQFLSSESIKILTPTLREAGSELWISANPLNSADPFAQRFITPYLKDIDRQGFYEDDLHLIVKINHSDNKWFPESLEAERLYDLQHLPRALYDWIWEGAFNDSVDDSIIAAEWFDAAIDAHEKLGFKPRGAIVCSHDPSDEGKDDKAIVIRQGSVILDAQTRSFGDVNQGCDWAIDKAIEARADLFVWDCDGMGLTLKRQVDESLKGKKIDFKLFHGSEMPDRPNDIYQALDENSRPTKKERTNQHTFRNKRAQYYWQLRDRFYATYQAVEKERYIDPDKMISVSSKATDLKQLRSEICRVPRKYNSQGTIQILSKQDMLKRKIQSPNLADCAMMSLVEPDLSTSAAPMNFTTVY